MNSNNLKSLTLLLPTYLEVEHLLRILEGVPHSLYRRMFNTIKKQQGEPQFQVKWTNPDSWIMKFLQDEEQELALKIWQESKHQLNPRHVKGPYRLSRTHNLLDNKAGIFYITDRGKQFLDEADKQIELEIDKYEGILTILQWLAERGASQRNDILPSFIRYCHTFTTSRKESVIKHYLYKRLLNLISRNYVKHKSPFYEITEAGLAYMESQASSISKQISRKKLPRLQKLAQAISREAYLKLADYLNKMPPFKFERLIKFLLEDMGYTEVEVISAVNDGDINVVANIQLGISSVREVIQVKRQEADINREILDAFRESLLYYGAVHGTIITTSDFSTETKLAAFEAGAIPITLINGEKMQDLLKQYQIGIITKSVEYVEFAPNKLTQIEKVLDKM